MKPGSRCCSPLVARSGSSRPHLAVGAGPVPGGRLRQPDPARLLSVPPQGWVNLHFSLLPARGRGAGPTRRVARRRPDRRHHLPPGPGHGHRTGVRDRRGTDRSPRHLRRGADPARRGGSRTSAGHHRRDRGGELVAVPQPADGASLAPKIEVADARVDWSLRTWPSIVRSERARPPPEPGPRSAATGSNCNRSGGQPRHRRWRPDNCSRMRGSGWWELAPEGSCWTRSNPPGNVRCPRPTGCGAWPAPDEQFE